MGQSLCLETQQSITYLALERSQFETPTENRIQYNQLYNSERQQHHFDLDH